MTRIGPIKGLFYWLYIIICNIYLKSYGKRLLFGSKLCSLCKNSPHQHPRNVNLVVKNRNVCEFLTQQNTAMISFTAIKR